MILLNDEEIARAFNSCGEELVPSDWDLHCEDDIRSVAKAQLRKMVEWGEGFCEHFPPRYIDPKDPSRSRVTRRRRCDKCWKVLLDEVKE